MICDSKETRKLIASGSQYTRKEVETELQNSWEFMLKTCYTKIQKNRKTKKKK